MREEIDRNKRYANPPKAKHGKIQNRQQAGAHKDVERTTAKGTGAPSDAHPGPVGKVGNDPGPEGGRDTTWGIIAGRHKAERDSMHGRRATEDAHTHERRAAEDADMHNRHAKELQNHMEQAAKTELATTAGNPKELGNAKNEGRKGNNV
jgi:hypothetical protein